MVVRGALPALLVPRVVLALRAAVCESMIHQILVIDSERSWHGLDASRRCSFFAGDIREAGRCVWLAPFRPGRGRETHCPVRCPPVLQGTSVDGSCVRDPIIRTDGVRIRGSAESKE